MGVDSVTDAVGVDAEQAHQVPPKATNTKDHAEQASPDACEKAEHFRGGGGPTQTLAWAVDVVTKAGTAAIIRINLPTHERA